MRPYSELKVGMKVQVDIVLLEGPYRGERRSYRGHIVSISSEGIHLTCNTMFIAFREIRSYKIFADNDESFYDGSNKTKIKE
jgi:hypothetical protein